MLFSELYKIMLNKVTLIGLGGDRPLDPPLTAADYMRNLSPCTSHRGENVLQGQDIAGQTL